MKVEWSYQFSSIVYSGAEIDRKWNWLDLCLILWMMVDYKI